MAVGSFHSGAMQLGAVEVVHEVSEPQKDTHSVHKADGLGGGQPPWGSRGADSKVAPGNLFRGAKLSIELQESAPAPSLSASSGL